MSGICRRVCQVDKRRRPEVSVSGARTMYLLSAVAGLVLFFSLYLALSAGSGSSSHTQVVDDIMEVKYNVIMSQLYLLNEMVTENYPVREVGVTDRRGLARCIAKLDSAEMFVDSLKTFEVFRSRFSPLKLNQKIPQSITDLIVQVRQLRGDVLAMAGVAAADWCLEYGNVLDQEYRLAIALADNLELALKSEIENNEAGYRRAKLVLGGLCALIFSVVLVALIHVDKGRMAYRDDLDETGVILKEEKRKHHLTEKALEAAYGQLFALCDRLDVHIYISTLDTNQILYMNSALKAVWGDCEGKICWQALHRDRNGPCEYCQKHKLPESVENAMSPVVSNRECLIGQRWIRQIDQRCRWHDGTDVHLGIRLDITQHKLSESQRLEYLRRLQILSARLAAADDVQRKDLAQTLHDGIGQDLFAMKMALGALSDDRLGDGGAVRLLNDVRRMLDGAITATRHLTSTLYPPLLSHAGLEPALETLVADFSVTYKSISYRFETRGRRDSNDLGDQNGIVFNSIRELLVNVAKHSRASQATVSLLWEDKRLIVQVMDDGIGMSNVDCFDVGAKQSCFGLFSIRERLRGINGTLSMRSDGVSGTMVRLNIPLDQTTRVKKGDRHESESLVS